MPEDRRPILAALVLIFVGCATVNASPTLAGTSWRLVSIQSSDDAQGTTPVADPSKFTVSFGTTGGPPSRSTATAATARGRPRRRRGWFRDTDIRADRHHSDDVPAAVAGSARLDGADLRAGYLIKDGQLHMSLLADAGILTWEPA